MTAPEPPARPDPAAGVFETVRVERGAAVFLADHLDRLRASVRALYGAELRDELDACVAGALGTAPDDAARRLRVLATPSSEAAVRLEASLAPLGPAAKRTAVPLRPWTVPGGLGAHKWTDRRAIDDAAARLDATPLIVEPGAEVLEAGWGNVWALEGARLLTPPTDGRILPGVTRARLLGLADELGLEAAEERLSVERLARADAILLTSALRLAVPGYLANAPDGKGTEVATAITAALLEAAI
ncbi:MAG TPA: aminotransferase class IV [Candidatus Limnocylindria bacterium]|nr:aminotransferase class IV [Candidatus Limnocylindria bacterium]